MKITPSAARVIRNENQRLIRKYGAKPAPPRIVETKKVLVPTNGQLAARLRKLENQEEKKYKDVYSTSAITGGLIISIAPLAQGDDFNNRIGEEIIAQSLQMKARLYHAAPGSTVATLYRLIVGWDLQANGAPPNPLVSTGTVNDGLLDDSTITPAAMAPYNYRTKDRYKILYDKNHIFNPQSSAAEGFTFVKKNFLLGNAKVKYSDSGATITSLPSRNLFCFVISNSTSPATLTLGFRMYYKDA